MGAETKKDRDLSEDSGLADIMEIAAAIGTKTETASDGHGITPTTAHDDDDLHKVAAGYGGVAAASLVPSNEPPPEVRIATAKEGTAEPANRAPKTKRGAQTRSREDAVVMAAKAEPVAAAEGGGGTTWMILGGLVLLGGIVAFATLRDDGTAFEEPSTAARASMEPATEEPVEVAQAEPLEQDDALEDAADEPIEEIEEEPALIDTEGEPEDAAVEADEAADDSDPQPAEKSKTDTRKRRSKPRSSSDKSRKSTKADEPPPEDVEPEPAADPPAAEPAAPPPPPEPAKKDDASKFSTDCLLNPDKPGCAAKKDTDAQKKTGTDANLPEKLTLSEIRSGLGGRKSAAKACGTKHGAEAGTKVTIKLSIAGATGKVVSASALSPHDGVPLGKCVAEALSSATFPRFRTEQQGTTYPVRF